MKDTVVVYVHGKGGSIEEADHYRFLFPYDVIGLDYKSETPMEAKDEFYKKFKAIKEEYANMIVIGNSIGAYFTMIADVQEFIQKAYFISPIVDMEKLILDMMRWANVNEEQLEKEKEIQTEFGEALSWEYLSFVREHLLDWNVYTHVLYGEKDNLTSLDTMQDFTDKHSCSLHVMKDGEHWFHTDEQLAFLDQWILVHEKLIDQADKLHTTEMGIERIQKNLGLEEDVVEYCKKIVKDPKSKIYRNGKNWYVENRNEILTINANSLTIITAHKRKYYE